MARYGKQVGVGNRGNDRQVKISERERKEIKDLKSN